jgi:hypothetical protein
MSTPLPELFAALRADLVHEDGPRISTMRNYRFAILCYDPAKELALRREVQRLGADLAANGWMVLPIDLEQLFVARIRAEGEEFASRVIAMEKRLARRTNEINERLAAPSGLSAGTSATADAGRERALNHLKQKLTPILEGPTGIAADCSRRIAEYADAHPDTVDRTVALIGRVGSLYPFFRCSALLRHLDGNTRNVPVVLLYPGKAEGGGLRFMGELAPDSDYRPRIYA